MGSRTIGDSIAQIAGTFQRDIVSIVLCTVDSVNGKTCDCTPVSGDSDAQITGVNLAAEDNDGILITPAVGSTVLIVTSIRNDHYVIGYEDIQSFQIVINGSSPTKFLFQYGLIQLNDGSYGGLTITPELKTQLDKTNDLLQAIINILSGPPINEPGNGAPSALQAALGSAISSKALGDFSNIENTLITHGQ